MTNFDDGFGFIDFLMDPEVMAEAAREESARTASIRNQIDELTSQRSELDNRIADWAGRVYKKTGPMVPTRGDEFAPEISAYTANEARRRRMLNTLRKDRGEIDGQLKSLRLQLDPLAGTPMAS